VSGAFLVAGTGTDVGKTYVAAQLIASARAVGRAVAVTKPVMSGVDEADLAVSDAGVLLSAAGVAPTSEAVAEVAPWRFAAALAPTAAARAEGRSLAYEPVRDFCRARLALDADIHLVETAGGIMSPIADGALCLDLAADLGLPVLLVAGAYLGAVSHTLTAIGAIQARGLAVAAVVVNAHAADAMSPGDLITELQPFARGVPLFEWGRDSSAPPAGLEQALSQL
jgi:dethiobiotin synthetase